MTTCLAATLRLQRTLMPTETAMLIRAGFGGSQCTRGQTLTHRLKVNEIGVRDLIWVFPANSAVNGAVRGIMCKA